MLYILLWLSLLFIATAVVLSLVLWRRQGENSVLLMTALLLVVMAHAMEFAYAVLWAKDATALEGAIQLITALVCLGTVVAAGRFMGVGLRRQRAIQHVQAALNEAEHGLSTKLGQDFFRHATHTLT